MDSITWESLLRIVRHILLPSALASLLLSSRSKLLSASTHTADLAAPTRSLLLLSPAQRWAQRGLRPFISEHFTHTSSPARPSISLRHSCTLIKGGRDDKPRSSLRASSTTLGILQEKADLAVLDGTCWDVPVSESGGVGLEEKPARSLQP